MADLQFVELLSILQSPKGVLSVTLAISSFAALIYILLTKSVSSSGKSKSKKATSKQSSPAKQSSAVKSAKTTPAKTTSNSTKKETPKTASAIKSKTSNDKKSDAKPADSKTGPVKVSSARTKQSSQANGPQKSNHKDEGEWITVSKKKPRVSKKATSPEQPSAPKTRSSTRLGSLGASRI